MKWNALASPADELQLQADWENGKKIGTLRAGERWLFRKGAFTTSYVAYQDILWAYRQIETVNGKLCCGKASFDIHHVIVLTSSGEKMDIRFEEKVAAQELLDIIEIRNPKTEIGFSQEKKVKFAG